VLSLINTHYKRYEAFYEGQGDGGKEGAIETTAEEDMDRCVLVSRHE